MQLLTADSVNKRELEITKTEKTKRTLPLHRESRGIFTFAP